MNHVRTVSNALPCTQCKLKSCIGCEHSPNRLVTIYSIAEDLTAIESGLKKTLTLETTKELNVKIEGGLVIVEFSDPKQFQTKENVLKVLAEAFGDQPGGYLILNFDGVSSLDSQQLGKLVQIDRHAKSCRLETRFCGFSRHIGETINRYHLNRIFQIHETVENVVGFSRE